MTINNSFGNLFYFINFIFGLIPVIVKMVVSLMSIWGQCCAKGGTVRCLVERHLGSKGSEIDQQKRKLLAPQWRGFLPVTVL